MDMSKFLSWVVFLAFFGLFGMIFLTNLNESLGDIKEMDRIEKEIGLRITPDEYECYHACDGLYYYSPPTRSFFGGSSGTCTCGIINTRVLV